MFFYLNIIATTVFIHRYIFKNINKILFENWQGINPMGLNASLEDKINYIKNMKMSPTFLKYNTKNQGIYPIGLCAPWAKSFINNQNKYQNIEYKTKMTSC